MTRILRFLSLLIPVLVLLASRSMIAVPADAAPAPQAEPSVVVYLPLVLHNAQQSDLNPGPHPPASTPTGTAAPPTVEPPATVVPTVTPKPPIEIVGDWVRTPHYALLSPSPRVDKRELGLMMEQFYGQATDYFGAEPEGDERLVGKIFADVDSYRAGLAADGIGGSGGSGGYYHPSNRTFYLHVQPSRHYTRQLTMHEAAHQLQHLAGGCRNPGWWTEGEAEHLGMHTWDGQTLQTSRQPLITLEDYPQSALQSFQAKGNDFGYIVRGESGWSYRDVWTVVSFLHDAHPADFGELRELYCAGTDSAEGWRAVFGELVSDGMNDGCAAWLGANQQPWDWIWNAFEPWGEDGLHGYAADTNALAAMKQRPEALTVELEPVSESFPRGGRGRLLRQTRLRDAAAPNEPASRCHPRHAGLELGVAAVHPGARPRPRRARPHECAGGGRTTPADHERRGDHRARRPARRGGQLRDEPGGV